MIQLQSVSKAYGQRSLFQDISLSISKGEKIGFLGRNGTGKSTLLKFISGEETPDTGSVILPKGYRVGYLSQHINFSQSNLLDEACLGLPEEEKYSSYLVEEILMGLGFSLEDFKKKPESFSGGYQLRIQLAKILASNPDLLLLDEPTNFLDLPSIRWVEKFFRKWQGEMIIISHDREFLDAICQSMALLHRGKLFRQSGSTAMIYEQVAQHEEVYERTRQNVEKKKAHMQKFVDRFGAKATKAAQAQSRVKAISKLPSLTRLSDFGAWDLEFPYLEYKGKKILEVEHLGFSYHQNKKILEGFNWTLYRGKKVACIGKNGKGKSTLLSLIAGYLKPSSGKLEVSDGVSLSFFGQGQSFQLDERATIEEEIASSNAKLPYSDVRRICGLMMFSGDLAEKQRSVLSGGEKSRVLLGKTIAKKANFLLLDEPTNHLDVESIEALIEAIDTYEGAVLLVTHSEHVLKSLHLDHLIVFNEHSVDVFDGNYEEYLSSSETLFFEEDAPAKPKKPKKSYKKGPSDALKVVRKKVRDLESHIEQEEIIAAKLQEDLIQATYDNSADKIAKFSKAYDASKEKIDAMYISLSSLHDELEETI